MFFYSELEEIVQQIYTNWLETQKLTASDKTTTDFFGWSVALSKDGTTAVIGAPKDDVAGQTNAGSSYIFSKVNGAWVQTQKIVATDSTYNANFGQDVSISENGSTIIVGAHWKVVGTSSQAGCAYIFEKSGSTWTQTKKITASDAQDTDWFGYSVSLSGDGATAVVGARYEDSGGTNAGCAYIFEKITGVWSQSQKIVSTDIGIGDAFGDDVAISNDGTTIVISALSEDPNSVTGAGSVYIFTKYNGTWAQYQKIWASDAQSNAKFGSSVCISSDASVIAVGALEHDLTNKQDAGVAYIFEKSGLTWAQVKKISASDSASDDNFGNSIAISGDGKTVVVGAKFDTHGNATNAGSAYVYKKTDSVWSQTKKLIASDFFMEDQFGFYVSIDEDASTILVSAAYEDPDDINAAGSVYVFEGQ